MSFMIRGYMAPEYVIRGKLTEKADVYSFGVLVVEIVSGKKNSSYVLNTSSILQTVSSSILLPFYHFITNSLIQCF